MRAGAADGGRRASRCADVIGLELAGTGLRYDAATARGIIKSATATQRPAGLRDLLWQPTDLYPAEVLTGMTTRRRRRAVRGRSRPRTGRDRTSPRSPRRCACRSQFSVAEHERVWRVRHRGAGRRSRACSPRRRGSSSTSMPGSGHNLQLSAQRRGVSPEGAVVRRGMRCRAGRTHRNELEAG